MRTTDVVLLDMNFALGQHSGREGLNALARLRVMDPCVSVVLMTAYGSVTLAVEALKQGAVDFVLKPWRNEELVAIVRAACERTRAAARRPFARSRYPRAARHRAGARAASRQYLLCGAGARLVAPGALSAHVKTRTAIVSGVLVRIVLLGALCALITLLLLETQYYATAMVLIGLSALIAAGLCAPPDGHCARGRG